ncbi:hypothetical protein MRX96_046619 [Rhipicephalus microplus]
MPPLPQPPEEMMLPPVESAWERGLRHAKELMKRASRRKEQEPDFEEKRLNIVPPHHDRTPLQSEVDKENDFYGAKVGGKVIAAGMISMASMSQTLLSILSESPEIIGMVDATITLKCAGAIGRSMTTGIEGKRTEDLVGVMIEKKVAILIALDLIDHMAVALKGNHAGGSTASKSPHLQLQIVHDLMNGEIHGGGQRLQKVEGVDPKVVIGGPFQTVPPDHVHPGHQGHLTVALAALLLEALTPVMTAVPGPGHLPVLLLQLEGHVAIGPPSKGPPIQGPGKQGGGASGGTSGGTGGAKSPILDRRKQHNPSPPPSTTPLSPSRKSRKKAPSPPQSKQKKSRSGSFSASSSRSRSRSSSSRTPSRSRSRSYTRSPSLNSVSSTSSSASCRKFRSSSRSGAGIPPSRNPSPPKKVSEGSKKRIEKDLLTKGTPPAKKEMPPAPPTSMEFGQSGLILRCREPLPPPPLNLGGFEDDAAQRQAREAALRQQGVSPKPQIKLTLIKKSLPLAALCKKEEPAVKNNEDKGAKKRPASPKLASSPSPPPTGRKSTTLRREELLKQLKAVEDAIARKRAKFS